MADPVERNPVGNRRLIYMFAASAGLSLMLLLWNASVGTVTPQSVWRPTVRGRASVETVGAHSVLGAAVLHHDPLPHSGSAFHVPDVSRFYVRKAEAQSASTATALQKVRKASESMLQRTRVAAPAATVAAPIAVLARAPRWRPSHHAAASTGTAAGCPLPPDEAGTATSGTWRSRVRPGTRARYLAFQPQGELSNQL